MSKVLLKLDEAEVDAVDAGTEDAGAFKSMLHSIINVQNYQIHYFRNCAQQPVCRITFLAMNLSPCSQTSVAIRTTTPVAAQVAALGQVAALAAAPAVAPAASLRRRSSQGHHPLPPRPPPPSSWSSPWLFSEQVSSGLPRVERGYMASSWPAS